MNHLQILFLLLFIQCEDKKEKLTVTQIDVKKESILNKRNTENTSNNYMHVIVQSDDLEYNLNNLKGFYKIKYHLPMIQSYVIEIEKKNLHKIETMKNVFKYEVDTHITAQMNRARDIINVKWAHEKNIFGENIGVAIVDTGICRHPDFVNGKNRIIAFKDFISRRIEPYDDNGHGTHVAGIIGGSGYASDGVYVGIAPKCNLIAVKVLNSKGNGNISDVLAGLQWIIDHKEKYNIRIVNISVGTSINDNIDEDSLLVKGVNAVWDSGIVVVVAAGNNGPKPMSISTPGISRKVITVGASDDNISVELSGNKTTDYSGRGPTQACIKKPDIVAPGSNIVSCNVVRDYMNSNNNCTRNRVGFNLRNNRLFFNPPRTISSQSGNQTTNMYTIKSGTSMATPIVSGSVALLISKYPEISNKEIKIRLMNAGIDLGYPRSKQGWGLLNIPKLLE